MNGGLELAQHDFNSACIRIYLSIHVSELDKHEDITKKAWEIGQELYGGKKHDDSK